jgi:hypothetical protein
MKVPFYYFHRIKFNPALVRIGSKNSKSPQRFSFCRETVSGAETFAHTRSGTSSTLVTTLRVDWSFNSKGPDGEDVHLGGSPSDIVRRGADAFWRYIIDNNEGTAVRQPPDTTERIRVASINHAVNTKSE